VAYYLSWLSNIQPSVPAWITAINVGEWGSTGIGTLSASGKLQTGGEGVFSAWGGAVMTPQGVYNGTTLVSGPALVAFGGGHSDYAGNEVYAIAGLDSSPAYYRLRDKSSPAVENTDQNGAGDPVSRHTYQTIAYVGGSNNWMQAMGTLYRYSDSGGSAVPYRFDFNQSDPNVNQPWGTRATLAGAADVSCWDSTTNRVWYHQSATNQVGYYDVAGNTNTSALFKSPLLGTNAHSAIDEGRGLWFAVWSGSTAVQGYRLNNGTANDYYTVSTTGTAPTSGSNKSIVWDSTADRFIVYSGNGKQIFFLTPPSTSPYNGGNPWVWTSDTPAGGVTPGTTQTNGTFGRFALIEVDTARGCLLWNNSTEEPVFYRIA
jgi:hypothetical protein